MMSTDNPRVAASLRRYAADNRPLSELLLRFIGADIAFADDVLGDLTEERARRVSRDGVRSADLWYIGEAFRAVPHLASNAVRHGGARGRARVTAIVAALALLVTGAVYVLRSEPVPVRLELEGQRNAKPSDGIVVNTIHPVRLVMRALDAKGNALKATDVRYRWMSGAPVSVAVNGIVTCTNAGDALLRASLGALATTVRLHCLPVKRVRADAHIQFVVGGPPRELAFVALDPDGLPVNRLAGELRVLDSSIATLEHGFVRPLAPGNTSVSMQFGDASAMTWVSVYEPIHSFADMRSTQRLVVAPLELAPGDTVRWPLPLGLFDLYYWRGSNVQPIPSMSVDGPIMCLPDFGPNVERVSCLARGPGVWLRIAYPRGTASVLEGAFALERRKQ
ncbi:MAG: hypothetical protein ABIT20_24655 [Gemmatimonadaceae bacterium]